MRDPLSFAGLRPLCAGSALALASRQAADDWWVRIEVEDALLETPGAIVVPSVSVPVAPEAGEHRLLPVGDQQRPVRLAAGAVALDEDARLDEEVLVVKLRGVRMG